MIGWFPFIIGYCFVWTGLFLPGEDRFPTVFKENEWLSVFWHVWIVLGVLGGLWYRVVATYALRGLSPRPFCMVGVESVWSALGVVGVHFVCECWLYHIVYGLGCAFVRVVVWGEGAPVTP